MPYNGTLLLQQITEYLEKLSPYVKYVFKIVEDYKKYVITDREDFNHISKPTLLRQTYFCSEHETITI